jgi:multiple sugar transport system substrate-binding protein
MSMAKGYAFLDSQSWDNFNESRKLIESIDKDLFKEAGLPDLPTRWDDKSWNWDKMLEYSQKLTNNYGQGVNAPYGVVPTYEAHQIAYMWGTDPCLPEHYKTDLLKIAS